MIIRSGAPVEVCEFYEGWEDPMLIGDHFAYVLFAKKGAAPEVVKTDMTDTQTIAVANMVAEEVERDFRTLGYTYTGKPTEHHLTMRVGDIATSVAVARNNVMDIPRILQDASRSHIPKNSITRIGDMPPRPFRLNGRGITHKDGISNERDADSVMYTLTNQGGTLHYDQRFFNPFNWLDSRGDFGRFCGVLFAAPLLHLQARPGAAVRLQDNVLYRTSVNRDLHAPSRQDGLRDKQRVFFKVASSRVMKKAH